MDAGVSHVDDMSHVDGQTSELEAGVAAGSGANNVDGETCELDVSMSNVDGQTSELKAGVATGGGANHVDGETCKLDIGMSHVDGEMRERAARYPVDAEVAVSVTNVDGQTCDLIAEVSKTVEGGMLKIQEGGNRRRKSSEKFEKLLRKFDSDPQGVGGRSYC